MILEIFLTNSPMTYSCSTFIPTCTECSTTFPTPGVAAVRGESATAMCRECHRKMGMVVFKCLKSPAADMNPVLKIPEVKFLRIASAAGRYKP